MRDRDRCNPKPVAMGKIRQVSCVKCDRDRAVRVVASPPWNEFRANGGSPLKRTGDGLGVDEMMVVGELGD